ncbi:CapA family protein [Eggerthellaceae bacterium 24-137]
MLIVGDLACPTTEHAHNLTKSMRQSGLFDGQLVFCNLEGLLAADANLKDEKLFNVAEVLDAFCPERTVFSLANNHTYDYPQSILKTKDVLEGKGFGTVGLVRGHGFEPCVVQGGSTTYALFAHCWDVYTRTNPNKLSQDRIVDCDYEAFVGEVCKYAAQNPNQRVVCYFHWNYDLETLPFPMHRKLAKDLIDGGVFAVVGGHSHLPQGGEMHKGRPIVYGFGNFFIPSNEYFGGSLVYPNCSKTTMALEIDDETGALTCHWFATDCRAGIKLISSEGIEEGTMITGYSPYRGLGEREYESFFRKNRRKRLLVPVFSEYRGAVALLKRNLAVLRIRAIKKIKG